MNVVLLLANEKNLEIIKDDKTMLDFCLDRYQSINSIDYFIICVPINKYNELISKQTDKILFYSNSINKQETIINAFEDFRTKVSLSGHDKLIIHDVNFANTENRIISDIISKSLSFNFINTILPFDNTFEIINEKGSQFLVKNKKEVYIIQSPQLLHINVYDHIYLSKKENTNIKMMNVLGSKYNYDLSDELMLKLFCND